MRSKNKRISLIVLVIVVIALFFIIYKSQTEMHRENQITVPSSKLTYEKVIQEDFHQREMSKGFLPKDLTVTRII